MQKVISILSILAIIGLVGSQSALAESVMDKINAEKKLVRRLPSQGQVSEWVSQAKSLPRKLTY